MGKIIASYLVRITLREPTVKELRDTISPPPTNDEIAQAVKEAIDAADAGVTTVTSERLDQ